MIIEFYKKHLAVFQKDPEHVSKKGRNHTSEKKKINWWFLWFGE